MSFDINNIIGFVQNLGSLVLGTLGSVLINPQKFQKNIANIVSIIVGVITIIIVMRLILMIL